MPPLSKDQYKRIFEQMPADDRDLIQRALSFVASYDRVQMTDDERQRLVRIHTAIRSIENAPPQIRVTYDYRPDKNQLLVQVRHDEDRTIQTIVMDFLNSRLIEGEWTVRRSWASEDRIFTYYDVRKRVTQRSRSNGRRASAKKEANLLESFDKLPKSEQLHIIEMLKKQQKR